MLENCFSLPPVDPLINYDGATRRPAPSPIAAAPWRSAAFLCVVGMASLLSACGGGGGGTDGLNSTATYTIGGTLSGLADGQTLDLTQGSETLIRSANGTFTFVTSVAQGGSYEVKLSGAQPAWQTCSISNGTGSAVSANVSTVAVTCVSADTAATGLLNDTGIDWCSENITTPNTWVNNAVCSAVNWVGNLWGQQQDAFFGRDAQAKAGTLAKVGGGMAGFDFTKIGTSGKVLAKQGEAWSDSGTEAAGTQWDCVRDNVTGLVWEVKRNDANHLRHMGHKYAWYNPDTSINGGAVGYQTPTGYYTDDASFNWVSYTSPTCVGIADVNKCNTQSYVTAVNTVGLCGKRDWRMPSADELANLTYGASLRPTIDTNYFPNTASTEYWLSSPDAQYADSAWLVDFRDGESGDGRDKGYARRVRLVHSGQ